MIERDISTSELIELAGFSANICLLYTSDAADE
mgnify:CR=1 FL=1